MSLPPVDPAVTAEAVAALPARLRKRLDEVVAQVQGWPVETAGGTVTVRPDGQTSVTLRVPVVAAEDAVCDCLLSPRCLHRAAVLSAAPVLTSGPGTAPAASTGEAAADGKGGSTADDCPAQGESADASALARSTGDSPDRSRTTDTSNPARTTRDSPDRDETTDGSNPARTTDNNPDRGETTGASDPARSAGDRPDRSGAGTGRVSAAQAGAARDLWAATAAVLANGIGGAGAVAQADLLRAVHQARATGLHGPAAAATRVVERLRAARRDEPAFRLADLTDDLRDVLGACHRLASGDGTVAGVARRDYEPVGDLRLYGLFCEPVRAATGHSGAVTYLVDGTGRLWTVSDVKPADQPAAASAVRAPVDLGEVRLSHQALARAGLRAVNAHASATGRLSHGRARQAVSASGAGWSDPPLDSLWQAGPGEQAARWLTATALPPHERPASHDLAFLDGVVLGADHRGLLLTVGGRGLAVAVSAPHEDPALPYVTNLRLLAAHAAGRWIRLIGRFTGPRRVDGLAFAASWLPDTHGGHVDLGATTLTRADFSRTADRPSARNELTDRPPTPTDTTSRPAPNETAGGSGPVPGGAEAPPLHLLRHQVERVAAAGRAALLSGVGHDARRLAAAHLGTASAVLTGLGAAGVRRTRDVFGRLDPHDAHHLARAWLTAAVYEHAASQAATQQAWTTTGAPDQPGAEQRGFRGGSVLP